MCTLRTSLYVYATALNKTTGMRNIYETIGPTSDHATTVISGYPLPENFVFLLFKLHVMYYSTLHSDLPFEVHMPFPLVLQIRYGLDIIRQAIHGGTSAWIGMIILYSIVYDS